MEGTPGDSVEIIDSVVASMRLRPGMYLGRLGQKGIAEMMHGLLRCLVSPDATTPDNITVAMVAANTITVMVEAYEWPDLLMECVSDFDKVVKHPWSWLYFIAPFVYSTESQLSINSNGVTHQFEFRDGILDLTQQLPLTEGSATSLSMRFTLDSKILKGAPSFDYLEKEVSIFALLHRNCKLFVRDTMKEYLQQRFYHYPEGVMACFDSLVAERSIGHTYFSLFVDEPINGRVYQVCLTYANYWQYPQPDIYLFADGKPTEEGSALLNGIIKGLRKACKEYIVAKGDITAKIPHALLYRGLVLVANVAGGGDYNFEGASRGRLALPDVEKTIKKKIYDMAKNHIANCHEDATELVSRFSSEIWTKSILADLEEQTKSIKEREGREG